MVKTFLITGHSLHKWAKYTIYCYVSYNMYLFCFCQHATYAQSTVLNLINMVTVFWCCDSDNVCVCVCWIGTRQTQLHGLASKLNQNLCNVLEVGPSIMVKHQWKVIYVQNTSLSARPLEHVHTRTHVYTNNWYSHSVSSFKPQKETNCNPYTHVSVALWSNVVE